MQTNYLIDSSDPQATITSDGTMGPAKYRSVQVYSTEKAPTYEMTYWNGRLTNDTQGNVYPSLSRAYATIGSEGVVWSSIVDDNGDRELDLTQFLLIRQAEGKIRVDSIIGLMPEDAEHSHDAYVGFCDKLCDLESLKKLKGMGCKPAHPLKYKLTKALLNKRAKATNPIEKKDCEDAIKKAEKGYQKWQKLFEALQEN